MLELSQATMLALVQYITFIWQMLLSKMTYIFHVNMNWEQFGVQCFSQGYFDLKIDQPIFKLRAGVLYQLTYSRPN